MGFFAFHVYHLASQDIDYLFSPLDFKDLVTVQRGPCLDIPLKTGTVNDPEKCLEIQAPVLHHPIIFGPVVVSEIGLQGYIYQQVIGYGPVNIHTGSNPVAHQRKVQSAVHTRNHLVAKLCVW